MNNNLSVIFFSSVLATFNPSLLAAVTVMLLLPQPKRLMLGYLLGAYTASIAAGLVIVFSLHSSNAIRTSKRTISPAEDVAIAAILLVIAFVLATGRDARVRAWRRRRQDSKASDGENKPPWQQRMLGRGSWGVTFVVGAVVSFPGVSYLNALDHIAKLNPPTLTILLLVLYFCLMQQILLEVPLLASMFAPDRTQAVVVRFKLWIGEHGRRIAVIGLSALGIVLAARGLTTLA